MSKVGKDNRNDAPGSVASSRENWYQDFFQGLALEVWRVAVPPEQTREEADFLQTHLALGDKANVLDVPCGNGRLALELAKRGHRVTGVDMAAPFLEDARRDSPAKAALTWERRDMRDLPWRNEFDGAYCFGNSFAYFDATGTEAFLSAVAGALKPGGRFVLDTAMAAETVLPDLEDRAWMPVGDLLLLVEHQYHAAEGRLDTAYTFVRDGRQETRHACHWIYTLGEIRRMLGKAGLRPLDQWEGTDSDHPMEYQYGSPRLLLLAEKE